MFVVLHSSKISSFKLGLTGVLLVHKLTTSVLHSIFILLTRFALVQEIWRFLLVSVIVNSFFFIPYSCLSELFSYKKKKENKEKNRMLVVLLLSAK